MVRRWCLIQVDLDPTISLELDVRRSGMYYYAFLAKHPFDAGKCENYDQWWPDWYMYACDSVSGDIFFDKRILFHPNINPGSKKSI